MSVSRNRSWGSKFLRGIVIAICLATVAVTISATFTPEINAGGGKKKKSSPPPEPPPPPSGGGGGAGCEIARGQDSLDILSAGIRHNVWFVLDSSGSMGGGFGNSGLSKMDAAKEIMKLLMSTLVDASGSPLVNWGYFPYSQIAKGLPGANNRDKSCPSALFPVPAAEDADGDGFMDNPGDCGGLDPNIGVYPVASACGQNNLQNLLDAVDLTFNYPGTPLGVAFDQIGDNIANNGWVDNLEPGQKNFIVHMTDGKDDCECLDFQYEDGTTTIDIRGSAAGPEVTISADLSGDKLIRTFNASLKAAKTLKQIDPTLDGSKSNIYMVGMGLGDTEKEMTHHLSWVSSGARLACTNSPQPDPCRERDLMHPAVFGNEIDELVDTLMEVLGIISTPVTEVSLGQSVVGSVKELIHLADSTITAPDLIADDVAGSLDKDDTDDARKIRNQYPNNVLFATSVVTPEWEGHLKAFNIYKVVNKVLEGKSLPTFQMLGMVTKGEIEATNVPGFFLSKVPELGVQTIPYLFEGLEHARRFPRSQAADYLAAKIENAYGVHVVSFMQIASSASINALEPIRMPGDFEGKKVANIWELYRAMYDGYPPAHLREVGYRESVEGGLVSGEFDVAIGQLQNTHHQKLYEYYTHQTVAPWLYNIYYTFIVNADFWNRLTAEQHQAIDQAAREAELAAVNFAEDASQAHFLLMAEAGVAMHRQTKAEREAWKAAFEKPVVDAVVKRTGDAEATMKLIQWIQDLYP